MRGFRVEGGRSFVGKQEGWVAGECAGDADALFLAAGKLFGVVIVAIGEGNRNSITLNASYNEFRL